MRCAFMVSGGCCRKKTLCSACVRPVYRLVHVIQGSNCGHRSTLIGEAHVPSRLRRANVGSLPCSINGSIKSHVTSFNSTSKTFLPGFFIRLSVRAAVAQV